MSIDVKIRGTLSLSEETKEEVRDGLEEYELDEIDELSELFQDDATEVKLNLDLHLSNHEAFELCEWMDDLAHGASAGHLFYWAENFEDDIYIKLEAGGKESELKGAFPT